MKHFLLSGSLMTSFHGMQVTPVERRRAAETVRVQLIALIESGELKIDARLPSESELAKSFAVSRSVIREALHSLSALGLTKSYAGRGTFVAATHIHSRLLASGHDANLSEVRQALEVPIARLAAERRIKRDITKLRTLLNDFASTETASDRVAIDANFHIAIAQATGNPLFPRLVAELRAALQAQGLTVSAVPGRHERASVEHQAILDAIAAGDGAAASRAMEAHLQAVIATADSAQGKGKNTIDAKSTRVARRPRSRSNTTS